MAEPRDCELCDCQQWEWNGMSHVMRSDPPSTCVCGHETSRHRVRNAAEVLGDSTADIDIYPVGALADARRAVRSLTRPIPWRAKRWAWKKLASGLQRYWRQRNHWNGYLAEPRNADGPWTRCGHGWTKARALRDLRRHMAEVSG